MKAVFFGSPDAALPSLEALLAAGHSVELVVTQPDRPAGRGRRLVPSAVKAFALEHNLAVIEPARIRTDDEALARIRAAGPDVNVVVAYGQIIPRSVHYFPRYHSLNVHFSLLPKYRGAAPVQRAVLNGDAGSGVTIIELDDRMDEGDILAAERVVVGPRETALSLETRLAEIGGRLLVATLARIDSLERVDQDDALATLAPKVRKEEGRLAWTDPAPALDRKVLALGDRPGVFALYRGKRIAILRSRVLEDLRPVAAEPGRIAAVGQSGLAIACGQGTVLLLEEVRPEGRSSMSAHAFSLGTKLSPGDRFE